MMATGFWDRKGVLLIDFLSGGMRYCGTLLKLNRAVENRWLGLLLSSVLYDNARPYVAAMT